MQVSILSGTSEKVFANRFSSGGSVNSWGLQNNGPGVVSVAVKLGGASSFSGPVGTLQSGEVGSVDIVGVSELQFSATGGDVDIEVVV